MTSQPSQPSPEADHGSAPPLLWSPDPDQVADCRLTAFEAFLDRTRGVRFDTYEQLWEWSVRDVAGFWAAIWDFFGLDDEFGGYEQVLDGDTMPGAQWFTGAHLNFAGYLLSRGPDEQTAVVSADERGPGPSLTWAQLRAQTRALTATLREAGVGPGHVVAGYLPNIPEAIVALLATGCLGATWSALGQDYAGAAVVARLGQLEPVVLVTSDGYRYAGREHDRLAEVRTVVDGLPSLRRTIFVDHLATPEQHAAADASTTDPRDRLDPAWQHWLDATARDLGPDDWQALPVPFDHPLWVLFSSGTTGVPKGLVHGHGGMLLETLKQLALQLDLGPTDRLFWYTSPSWMMWNFLVGALAVGAGVVCYEGSPTHPASDELWRIAAATGTTFLGTSPGYLQLSEAAGGRPRDHDLSALRAMGSTGSPISPQSHRWVVQSTGVPMISLSGGTDVCAAFVGGAPTVPIRAGEIPARCLGVAAHAWSEAGESVVGVVGELVITRPLPNLPLRLWGDPDGSRYRDTYFAMFERVWRQGDWVTITEAGSVVIHGRSDSTLNRHGVRMGSADIYAAVQTVPEVVESLVVGVEQPDGGYWMPLFVTLAEGTDLTDELAERVRAAIRTRTSPRHVPDEIVAVRGVPHTRTGKKLEVPIKRILLGADPGDVAHPDAVDDATLLADYAALADARRARSPR